jgi:hypothetical protein
VREMIYRILYTVMGVAFLDITVITSLSLFLINRYSNSLLPLLCQFFLIPNTRNNLEEDAEDRSPLFFWTDWAASDVK